MPLSRPRRHWRKAHQRLKLFEKFRWLPTEMPCPGTAEVSGEELIAGRIGGGHSGNEQMRGQEIRPFRGSERTRLAARYPQSGWRAVSRTVVSPVTVTLLSADATVSEIGSSNATPPKA